LPSIVVCAEADGASCGDPPIASKPPATIITLKHIVVISAIRPRLGFGKSPVEGALSRRVVVITRGSYQSVASLDRNGH
jgi:hypothetical protein